MDHNSTTTTGDIASIIAPVTTSGDIITPLTTTTTGEQCGYYVERKKRYCRVFAIRGSRYCGLHQHAAYSTDASSENGGNCGGGELLLRVACKYNPHHLILPADMERHLKKCPDAIRAHKQLPPFYRENVNCPSLPNQHPPQEEEIRASIATRSPSDLVSILVRVRDIVVENFSSLAPLVALSLSSSASTDSINTGCNMNNDTPGKHPEQVKGLIAIMNNYNLLRNRCVYVEFGCGRAELSASIARSLEQRQLANENTAAQDIKAAFLCIDKARIRMKKENLIRCQSFCVWAERLQMDIKDFHLAAHQSASDTELDDMVAVSKHLCGSATDLTLLCLLQAEEVESKLAGISIALCCHHRCSFQYYCNHDYLRQNRITDYEFDMISSICSWATSDKISDQQQEHHLDDILSALSQAIAAPIVDGGTFQYLDVDKEQRRIIGLVCKRIIDLGRIQLLQRSSRFSTVALKPYVAANVSLENLLLLGVVE